MARSPTTDNSRAADDAALFETLTNFMAAEKTLTAAIAWVLDGADLRFAATLDIEGVTAEGITLFGRATGTLPDRKVTIGLRWQDEAGRGGNFDRLEWKPIKAHTNRPNAPAHLRLRVIEGSHRHPLALNGALAIGLMRAIRENLPVAEPLDVEPPDWPALLAVGSLCWRIKGLVHVPPPPWQYGLLTAGRRSKQERDT